MLFLSVMRGHTNIKLTHVFVHIVRQIILVNFSGKGLCTVYTWLLLLRIQLNFFFTQHFSSYRAENTVSLHHK